MNHLNQAVSINIVLVFSSLMMAAAANASLLDCSKSLGLELASGAECISAETSVIEHRSPGLNEVIPTPSATAASTGFQVNQTRSASAVPESAPLLVLIGALLAVVLVRAKSYNTK